MPIYLYKGYDLKSGASRKGKVEAESLRAARQKLKTKEKVIVSDLREEVSVRKTSTGGGSGLFSGAQKVTLQDLTIMTRQFATLQQAHVPLDECLIALTNQVENPTLRNYLSSIKSSVSEGKSLGDALSAFPKAFNRLYVNMVRAGEQSGNLGIVLERLADFQEYQIAVRGKILSALTYPSLMIVASLGITAYLFVSVVPKLEKVFISLKVTLPPFTQLLMNFSKFIQNRWYLILLGVAGLIFALRSWYGTEKGRMKADLWLLKAPLVGGIVMRLNVSKFTRTLSTLLSSGVPIITALEITRNIINNRIISSVMEHAKQAVQEGEALWATIEKSKQFPSLVVYMIRTGERTGELEQMLRHVSEAYDAEVERKIDAMIALIEPMMVLLMAGITVAVVMALLIPMLSIMSQVR
ncbi:MAG: type II secretion system F family protein [Deltaproteobacteria bacterium]|nr:type II secretion system F family protein [Deltaproteobacteria bacterium]